MTDIKPARFPSIKLVAIAAIAGILAGAVAVYMKETGSGNGTVALSTECAGARQAVASLSPFFKGQVAAMTPAADPRMIAGLAFTDKDGKPKTLADFGGKTVLLNLWATWCVPCREEMPALNTLQKSNGGADFEVVAINIDTGDDQKPKAFLSETGVDALGLYRDSSMGVFNIMKKEGLAFGLPVTLLIDKKGCLLGSMNGPAAWESPDAAALIAAAKGV